MVLVEYPDSDQEEAEVAAPERSPLTALPPDRDEDLPALPQLLRELYSSDARISNVDDPTLHGGRKRSVPHVAGNWPAHLYLEWHPNADEMEILDELIDSLQGEDDDEMPVVSSLTDDLGVPRPLHISLSAPLVLRTETKDLFHHTAKDALRSVAHNIEDPLVLSPVSIAWHENDQQTRQFLVMRVRPKAEMWRLLKAGNDMAAQFGGARLYEHHQHATDEDSPFHISIAWSVDPEAAEKVPSSSRRERHAALKRAKAMQISFSDVKIKLGREITPIPFRSKSRKRSCSPWSRSLIL